MFYYLNELFVSKDAVRPVGHVESPYFYGNPEQEGRNMVLSWPVMFLLHA